MPIEYIILALCILFGLLLIKISFSKFRRKKIIQSSLNFGLAVFLLSIGGFFLTFIIDEGTFQRLTHEHPVAQIEFHHLGEHHFQAILKQTNTKPVYLEIYGDQWQLDTRIIKWNGAAAWSGLKPMYRLERLSGRYQDIQLEKTATRTVYSLEKDINTSFWDFLVEYQDNIPWLDAYYGNAVYLPMSHGAKFTINITASSLIARPENKAARLALQHWPTPELSPQLNQI